MEIGWKILEVVGTIGQKVGSWKYMPKLFKVAEFSNALVGVVPRDLDISAPPLEVVEQIVDNAMENGAKSDSIADIMEKEYDNRRGQAKSTEALKPQYSNGSKPDLSELPSEQAWQELQERYIFEEKSLDEAYNEAYQNAEKEYQDAVDRAKEEYEEAIRISDKNYERAMEEAQRRLDEELEDDEGESRVEALKAYEEARSQASEQQAEARKEAEEAFDAAKWQAYEMREEAKQQIEEELAAYRAETARLVAQEQEENRKKAEAEQQLSEEDGMGL